MSKVKYGAAVFALLVVGALAFVFISSGEDSTSTATEATSTSSQVDSPGSTLGSASSSSQTSANAQTTEGANLTESSQVQSTAAGESSQDSGTTTSGSQSEPFVFAAAGDFTGGDNARLVFESIADRNSDFTLALGDLGYVGNGNEQQWCNLVKDIVGNQYPFQLVAGNHDDEVSGDGDILEYRKCLPNRVGNITGDYALQYAFDYNDLARFIMISPDITGYGDGYDRGGRRYEWVRNQAESAREEGMRWVFIGMHKNCVTPGQKSCEIGEDIFNPAIDAEIDVILQGHEHGFFRSKQLAFNENCLAIRVNTFDADCVADDDNNFEAGAGSVLVISGAGGIGLRDVDLNDEEIEYFSGISGKNVEPTHGYAEFTVSDERIRSEFIGVNGSFEDTFTISR